MAPAIRHDLQHAARKWVRQQGDSSNIQLDDAVIHFRCGDVLSVTKPGAKYGFSPYSLYDRFLKDTSIQSIGIVTAPLGPKSGRSHERKHMYTCQALVNDMVSYLEEKYPSTSVTVRNNSSETVVLAYVRMILANRVLCDSSTFCLFPAIASTGKGYIAESNSLYPWIHGVEETENNLHVLKRYEFLASDRISSKGMGPEDIVAWRRSPNGNQSRL
jgi:hypothetical protein